MRLFKFWMLTLVMGFTLWAPAQAATTTQSSAKFVPLIKVYRINKLNQGVRGTALLKFLKLAEQKHHVEKLIPKFLDAVILDDAWVKGISPKSWKLGLALSSPGGVYRTREDVRITGNDLNSLRQLILSEVAKQKKAD